MQPLFQFGKKRRTVRRKSVKSRKTHKKPPSRLLKICKKCHVKATKKVGGKRVYKSVSSLKKQCLKKLKVMKKKMLKQKKMALKHKKTHRKRRTIRRRDGFGELAFGKKRLITRRRDAFGELEFGRRRRSGFGAVTPMPYAMPTHFGKRSAKVSKAAAMKAFRSFYKRHCAGMRKTRFGNGGNPPLSQSMGYEFCPSGMGGVTGANSTGLFASPCTSMNQAQAAAESAMELPSYSSSYGRRRYRKKSSMKRKSAAIGTRKRSSAAFGRRRRPSKKTGMKRKSSAIGTRKKTSAIGTRKRSSAAIGRRRYRKKTSAIGTRRRSAGIGMRRRV